MPCNYDLNGDALLFEENWSGNITKGLIFFFLSAICDGFGNSLEPVSVLVPLSISFLIFGLECIFLRTKTNLNNWRPMLKYFGILTLLQGSSFLLGFCSLTAYPSTTFLTIVEAFGGGVLLSVLNIALVYIPYLYFSQAHKDDILRRSLAFATMNTMVACCVVGNVFSTFPAAANAVLDIGPLTQVASIFGVGGIQFLVVGVACCAALNLAYDDADTENIKRNTATSAGLRSSLVENPSVTTAMSAVRTRPGVSALFGLLLLLTVAGLLAQAGLLYQVPVSDLIPSTVPVSCVFSQYAAYDDTTLWGVAAARVAAGDAVVLMSEEAFEVHSDEEEQALLTQAFDTVATSPLAEAFLGVTYVKTPSGASMSTNQFALVSNLQNSADEPVWNYLKSHPVPLIEDDVSPGPGALPMHSSPTLGKLSGAICFDLDFPLTVQQAGQRQVDILLQPSWTWGAILSRHFNGDAVRAVENGFTLFRCSSDGESGVVGPRGRVLSRSYTGHNPENVALYSLPLQSHVSTVYNAGGLAFDWLCLAGSLVVYYGAFTFAYASGDKVGTGYSAIAGSECE